MRFTIFCISIIEVSEELTGIIWGWGGDGGGGGKETGEGVDSIDWFVNMTDVDLLLNVHFNLNNKRTKKTISKQFL